MWIKLNAFALSQWDHNSTQCQPTRLFVCHGRVRIRLRLVFMVKKIRISLGFFSTLKLELLRANSKTAVLARISTS